ncbi:helix-turn-helix transcriptional regulator [Jeotgalibacillus haloalkalitolerans]|uniref:Helix-turn-helix transcriptional regulator n=1 Tax=Jeotgalibacillus haloalkalitolerans TaxID=3104292 RepID=A0ABU5KMB9_9BACL|nr:helix-turn-helix transcriptional regulator [Jeotgalibacillus sp. HH7-29]MDZ5712277.1 helix-turn-helix transcriptional regulator [Jeotgalibacillus sp. HH7-29]
MVLFHEMPQITLKAARVNAGLTIMNASKLIGISHSTLVKWEANPGLVSPIWQRKIQQVYNFPINHIFFGETVEFKSSDSEDG